LTLTEIVKILDNFTELTAELIAELTAELTARKKQYEYYRNRLLTFDSKDISLFKLQDVVEIQRGIRVTRNQLSNDGKYPVYQNSLVPMGYYNDKNREANSTFLICAGAAGDIGYSTQSFWAADDCYTFDCSDKILNRYLFYVLKNKQVLIYSRVRRASVPRISKESIGTIKVPVPEISVQERIVNVLDNFDKVCHDLHIGLPAEIEARKKQYEFYRDSLLTFLEKGGSILTEQNRTELRYALIKLFQYVFGYVTVRISDVAETNIGLATSVTKYKTDKGVQLLHNSDIQPNRIVVKNYEYVSPEFAEKNYKKLLHKGDIITVHTGDVGTSAVIGDEFDGAIGFTTITTKIHNTDILMPAYLCHFLNSQKCKRQIAAMTISDRNNLNQSSFEKIRFEMPNLETQREIVRVLKNMDDLHSDISSGLPAEIEARKKQYEYYRDKLLSFKEKKG